MSRFRTIALFLVLFVASSTLSFGQNNCKIGYTNIELVLAYMPESKTMEQQLQTYQTQLSKTLAAKRQYAQSLLSAYQEKASSSTYDPAQRMRDEQDLQKLDQEITKLAQDSETKLVQKRQELLAPILTKLQKAIDEVAEANGYNFILNSNINGVSNVLYGPDQSDVTKLLLKKLGIQIPGE